MSETKLERRMADLEKQIAALREKIAELQDTVPWWERIAGTFHNDHVYRRAMGMGRAYRRAQKPNGSRSGGR